MTFRIARTLNDTIYRPIVSNLCNFILHRDKPSDFLQKKLQFTLQDLLYIHMGLGSQLLQFEFADDGARFTLIIGDSEWGERFAKMVQGK